MIGLKGICTLRTAGKVNENTPHCERRESWEAYTPAESLCWSFGIKAERSFLCWNLARRLLHRPLKPLGCFCSESIKSLLDVWSWKKNVTCSAKQVIGQCFKHNHPHGCSGITVLAWKQMLQMKRKVLFITTNKRNWSHSPTLVNFQLYRCLLFKCT